MSLRSQRPQNAPPPAQDGFANYRQPPPQSHPPPPVATAIPATSSASGQSQSQSQKPPPLSLEQSRQVARTHFDALKQWLHREGALANPTTRTNAREKLTRLTRQQFQELSTDVYDELVRRIEDAAGRPGEQPFLAVRSDFHPKRNQARQKLATLPLQRFRDLASDVYFELDRRYPEFSEDDQRNSPSRSDSLTSSHARHNAPSPTPPPPPNLNAQRRAPTPINTNSQPRSPIDHNPPPLSSGNIHTTTNGAPLAPTSNEVVVPNKSTMVVEAPAGNFVANNSATNSANLAPISPSNSTSGGTGPLDDQHHSRRAPSPSTEQSQQQQLSPLLNQQPTFNFGHGGGPSQKELDDRHTNGPFRGYGSSTNGHQSRASEVSSIGTSKFFGGYAGSTGPSEAGGRRSNELPPWDHEERQALEKQKNDYEYKLKMLQNRVQELERENQDASSALRGRTQEQDRLRDVETELQQQRARFEDQTSQLRLVQRDHDSLQQRYQQSQRERELGSGGGGNSFDNADAARSRKDLEAAEDLANELRGEVSSLVDELRQVNERCEELQTELDQEKRDKEDKEREAREWKERWQSAKTELRNIKATSQLFTSAINVERDFMPASSDGLISDTSVAAFQTSIDDLLQAARSKEPTSVISHARQVVSAVEKIDHDVQAISPSRFNSLSLQDQDIVNSLKAKINATLSNLMTASKNHATSFGVSPVSLLDAAASHLASTIVELVRILKIRRTSGNNGPIRSGSLGAASTSSRFQREPMPPLPEDNASYRSAASPPTQREPLPQTSPPPKSNGYVSGGVSSLVSSSTAGMRNALEAMGIASSSASRSSIEKDRESVTEPPARPPPVEESISSPQSDYGLQHQQQQQSPSQNQQYYNSFQPTLQRSQDNSNGTSYRSTLEDEQQQQHFDRQQYDPSQGQYHQEQYQGHDQSRDSRYSANGQNYDSHQDLRGSERNVEELRGYIENQTEAIVHSIQSLLSAIRSGSQGEQLNENLTQIITIVSSIVAISKDSLPDPPHSNVKQEGETILSDLIDHCDKLSEMQSETNQAGGSQTFTKQTKQAMATASFGVAKSLKQLNGLFASIGDSNEQGLV
ncbi:uncharacterized protein JCM15063_003576 [Sporobolomyces koalae]|uniref:uncharacterized protein n=1 Tax=Sporobolomyces koalae TaxID=500713 RepID=UPI00316F4C65